MLQTLIQELESKAQPEKAKILSSFFKTEKGGYGYGDKFAGITVPNTRSVAKKYYRQLNLLEVEELLSNPIHEYRLAALETLCFKYLEKDSNHRELVDFYLTHTKYINNWDLVDLSCYKILGSYCYHDLNGDVDILLSLAKSTNLWERRIAIVSTMYFVRQNSLNVPLNIVQQLLTEKEDLLHKANGWILREVGKKDRRLLEDFLHRNIAIIPRTTLRYAIEKFEPEKRKYYLNLK